MNTCQTRILTSDEVAFRALFATLELKNRFLAINLDLILTFSPRLEQVIKKLLSLVPDDLVDEQTGDPIVHLCIIEALQATLPTEEEYPSNEEDLPTESELTLKFMQVLSESLVNHLQIKVSTQDESWTLERAVNEDLDLVALVKQGNYLLEDEPITAKKEPLVQAVLTKLWPFSTKELQDASKTSQVSDSFFSGPNFLDTLKAMYGGLGMLNRAFAKFLIIIFCIRIGS